MKGLILLCLITLVGCANSPVGPVSSPDYSHLVAKNIPAEDGAIVLHSNGYWHPNERGFTIAKSQMYPPVGIGGVIVLTERALLFELWNDSKRAFDIAMRLQYSDVTEVEVDTMVRARRLVLQRRNYIFESFAFTHPDSVFIDQTKTDQAYDYLKKVVTKP